MQYKVFYLPFRRWVVCLSNIGIVLCSKTSCHVSHVRKGEGGIGACLLSKFLC